MARSSIQFWLRSSSLILLLVLYPSLIDVMKRSAHFIRIGAIIHALVVFVFTAITGEVDKYPQWKLFRYEYKLCLTYQTNTTFVLIATCRVRN